MEDLQRILKRWCNASGAKFNTQKTEIIPIGILEHRIRVIETRKAKRDSEEIPAYIHIAKDGEPVRILGTWIGNKMDNENVWSVQLNKIDHALEEWEKSNPTIEGRKLIIQMVVGGMTQYLTQVQGILLPQKRSWKKELENSYEEKEL